MEIGTAREYFHLGLLTAALVRAPSVLHEGWTIEMEGNTGNADPILRAARGQVREFKTLDAAGRAVREIGFKELRVITD
jgi:hypothetical protein